MFGNGGLSSGTTTVNVQSGTLTVSSPLVQDDADTQVSWMYVAGNGTLLLTASNTYTGGTWIGGGTLQLGTGQAGQDGTLLPASGITNNSTLVYNLHNSQTVSYPISGNGSLVKLGASQLTLTGTNAYLGLTTVGAGTLQIGAAANGGLNGNVLNNAALVFANPSSQTFGGSISGGGSFTKKGAGTLTMIGHHSYTGPTSIVSGVLQLGPANPDLSAGGWTVNSDGAFPNEGPAISGGSITLTDGNGGEGRSAFYGAAIPTNAAFTARFVYQASQFNGNELADGIVAMIQSDSRGLTAMGQPGGQLGYGGPAGSAVTPSIGLALNIYNGAPGGRGQALSLGGSINTPYSSTSPIDASNGDPIQVTLSYDGSSTLTETLMDLTNSSSYGTSFPVGNLAAALGSSAYFGVSGADGGAVSVQTISGVTFTSAALNGNILPKATALSIASGGTLDLNGINQQVASLSGSGFMSNSGGTLARFTVGGPGASTFAGTIGNGASPVALAVTGGKLTLSGTDTFTGGTTVNGGTLIVTNKAALADGSSLTVGSASFFPAPVVPAAMAPSAASAVSPVPEPGALSLAAAAVAGAVLCRRCRRAGRQRGIGVRSAAAARNPAKRRQLTQNVM
jgi:autotransporter-associated beta strand protein